MKTLPFALFLLFTTGCITMEQESLLKAFNEKFSTADIPVVQGLFLAEAKRKDHVLYTPCEPLTIKDKPYIEKTFQLIKKAMEREQGIGIAANQVGLPLQFFIIQAENMPQNERYKDVPDVSYQEFINPKIIKASKELDSFWHGCLSATGQPMGKVSTYQWIEYEALDKDLKPINGKLDSLAAIIFQHELRHLLGQLYIDKAQETLSREELGKKIEEEKFVTWEKNISGIRMLLEDYQIGESISQYKQRIGSTYL